MGPVSGATGGGGSAGAGANVDVVSAGTSSGFTVESVTAASAKEAVVDLDRLQRAALASISRSAKLFIPPGSGEGACVSSSEGTGDSPSRSGCVPGCPVSGRHVKVK